MPRPKADGVKEALLARCESCPARFSESYGAADARRCLECLERLRACSPQ